MGKLYIAGRANWPEGVEYNYRAGAHELRMFFDSPRPWEINSVQLGTAEFALVVERPIILFLYCFEPAIPWSDVPYSWQLIPDNQRTLPAIQGPETRALLQIVLVDASSGLVRALRAATFSPAFTRALHAAIWAQAAAPWVGQAAYDATLAGIYERYPTSADLLKRAIARTSGAE